MDYLETDRFNIALLLDYYGGLLTEKQRRYLDMYYNDDLSFAEIAEIMGVSRPGVFDLIDRSRKKLLEFERKTGLVARFAEARRGLSAAVSLAGETGADGKLLSLLNEVSNGV